MSNKDLNRNLRLALIAAACSLAFFGSGLFAPPAAQAVPSFARQTGMNCIACHTDFFLLNEYGRNFKLSGYTFATGNSMLPPISFMVQPSFTQTARGIEGGAAPRFAANSNFALTQASAFYAGRLFGPYAEPLFGAAAAAIMNKFGTFIQVTYDGVANRFNWDNVEFRFADTATLFGKPVTYGFYLNNNPGMSDLWNTTPVWGFPFSSSGLAPTPAAATLVNGGLSQQVGGVGGYMMIANTIYLELAAYHTLSTPFQYAMGIDPTGQTQIPGAAPYWRLAYTKTVGNSSYMIGLFGLAAHTYPGRDNTAGKDKITDFGFDAQYQTSIDKHDITVLLSGIYEKQTWNASQQLGLASNPSDRLYEVKATVDYLYDKTYGGAISYFAVNGSRDALLYSGSASGLPTSNGLILQANYIPFNKKGGPAFWPKSNLKLSVQYIIYNRFDGAHTNYDGAGRNARDNNTLYLEAWLAF